VTDPGADLDEQALGAKRPEVCSGTIGSEPSPDARPEPGGDHGPMTETRSEIGPFRQALELLGLRPWLVIGLVAISVPTALCESAVLVVVADVAGVLVTRSHRVSMTIGPLHLSSSVSHLLVLGAILAAVRIALAVPVSYLPARIIADAQARLRERLFSTFIRASWTLKSREQEGQLQELLTSQVLQATSIVGYVLSLVVTTATLVVLVASALLIGLVPALVVLGSGVALFALLRPLGGLGSRRARMLSAAQVDYANAVGEATRLAEEVQVFGAGRAQEIQHGHLVESVQRRAQVTSFILGVVPGVYYGMVLLLLIGGLSLIVATGAGRLVSLGAAILLLVRAANYGQQWQGYYQGIRQSGPFLERLAATEEGYRSAAISRGQGGVTRVPSVTFDRVSYSYTAARPVLRDLSFYVEAGEAIGIVGPTGAGKSTLVQILLGLRDPTSGRYLVDGEPALTISDQGLAQSFAYVSQEPRLIHATVAENIAFFRDIDREVIERAARLAHIDEDVRSWPHGYDTVIGQRADAVSGGQRQRICLARALAGEPFVLVLDEPTSSLDAQSESLIQRSLVELKGRLTLFVVAHRLPTLAFCDRVLVVVDGAVEAFAPAQELQTGEGFYRRVSDLHSVSMAESQAEVVRSDNNRSSAR
jgi:ATP-binding cassette subfamily B protein